MPPRPCSRAAPTRTPDGSNRTTSPSQGWESVLYGAAGLARHPELTRLLLEHGADPNDGETSYHVPASYDNRALKVLVESGKLNDDSLATMLLRKHDWHDYEGIKWLLEHGADPNRMTRWGRAAIHQAVQRDNSTAIIELLLDHRADPTLTSGGKTATEMAARRGRGDVLELFQRHGVRDEPKGLERLLAACATNDAPRLTAIAESQPDVVNQARKEGGQLLVSH